MRKGFVVSLALLISVAFVGGVLAQSSTEKATKAATDMAQEKAKASGEALKTEATQAATEKPAPASGTPAPPPEKKAEKQAVAKAKTNRAKGEVTALDMAAKTMTIKGESGDMTFDVGNAKMKAEPKVGDKVLVKYTEAEGKMVAKYVSSKKHHRAPKGPAKKEAAPQPAPAPEPGK